MRPPPSSALFPYTTLFRSQLLDLSFLHVGTSATIRRSRRSSHRRTGAAAERPDRKSTRLNSSHPSISYAVFCLKKKIITELTADVFGQTDAATGKAFVSVV